MCGPRMPYLKSLLKSEFNTAPNCLKRETTGRKSTRKSWGRKNPVFFNELLTSQIKGRLVIGTGPVRKRVNSTARNLISSVAKQPLERCMPPIENGAFLSPCDPDFVVLEKFPIDQCLWLACPGSFRCRQCEFLEKYHFRRVLGYDIGTATRGRIS